MRESGKSSILHFTAVAGKIFLTLLLFWAGAGLLIWWLGAAAFSQGAALLERPNPFIVRQDEEGGEDGEGAGQQHRRQPSRKAPRLTFGEVSLGLWLLRVDYYLIIGLLVAVVDILPVVGSGSVLVPWGLWTLLQGSPTLGAGMSDLPKLYKHQRV